MIEAAVQDRLRPRLGADRLLRRLDLENRHEARIARRQVRFLHRDHWYAHPTIIRALLWMMGLYARGCRNAEQVVARRNRVVLANLPRAFEVRLGLRCWAE